MPPPEAQRSGAFLPAPELRDWAKTVFLDPDSDLYSGTHQDIAEARVGWLWAGSDCRVRGREVAATAEIPRPPQGVNSWGKERYWRQVEGWFSTWWEASDEGEDAEPVRPDFIITVHSQGWEEWDDTFALSVVKHELLHCMQALDRYGAPRFNAQTGEPIYCLRPHDFEGFVEEIEWFGPSEDAKRIIEAASRPPRAGRASIASVCGTCLRAAA